MQVGGEGMSQGTRSEYPDPDSLRCPERVDDDVVDLVAPEQNVLPVERALPLIGLTEPGRRTGGV